MHRAELPLLQKNKVRIDELLFACLKTFGAENPVLIKISPPVQELTDKIKSFLQVTSNPKIDRERNESLETVEVFNQWSSASDRLLSLLETADKDASHQLHVKEVQQTDSLIKEIASDCENLLHFLTNLKKFEAKFESETENFSPVCFAQSSEVREEFRDL